MDDVFVRSGTSVGEDSPPLDDEFVCAGDGCESTRAGFPSVGAGCGPASPSSAGRCRGDVSDCCDFKETGEEEVSDADRCSEDDSEPVGDGPWLSGARLSGIESKSVTCLGGMAGFGGNMGLGGNMAGRKGNCGRPLALVAPLPSA